MPKALVGQNTQSGPVPGHLRPLFKDREEEAAGSSINAAVEAALAGSQFLLVVCSPRSAKSEWVNREIAWFKVNRDPANILALIVDGEPGASGIPGREEEECFPRALTHAVNDRLEVTEVEEDTPLAADARKQGDGKRSARLKIVAAMLGVKLDDLVKREERRRAFRTRAIVTASLTLAAVMSGLAWLAIQARDEAQVQRDQAEGLVEFMISDLREKLQPKVQLEVLGDIADRADEYYAVQSNYAMDSDALGRRSRVLKLLADLEQDRGNTEKSLQLFQQSLEASKRQLDLDPDNPQRILEHAYSLQGLGNVAYQQGDFPFALEQMDTAARLLGRLATRSDATEEWRAEHGSALANLGILQYQQRQLVAGQENLGTAIAIKRKAAEQPNAEWQDKLDLAFSLAWMAKIHEAAGEDAQAAQRRAEEEGIYLAMLEADPEDHYALGSHVSNRINKANALLLSGDSVEALSVARKAAADARLIMESDPGDMTGLDGMASAQLVLARAEFANGDAASSTRSVREANALADRLAQADAMRISWVGELQGGARLLSMRLAARRAPDAKACRKELAPIAQEAERLEGLAGANPANFGLAQTAAEATMLLGDHRAASEDKAGAIALWEKAREDLIRAGGDTGRPKDLASRRLLSSLNDRIEAGARANGLLRSDIALCQP